MDSNPPSPDTTPPSEDVGADTQRRYRHQAAYTAVLALGLLEDDGPDEIYCEHHDDVILRLRDGKFRALQLKTRQYGRPPHKAVDDDVIAALGRFAVFEREFPGQFDQYTIGSNLGFWNEKKNTSNLGHVLDGAQNGTPPPATWINKISKQGKVASNFVSDCLRKVQTLVTPGLDDVENRLQSHVAQQSTFRSRQFHEVKAAADALRERVAEACSLRNADCFPEYMALCSASASAAKQAHAIAMKRLRRAEVEAALKKGESPSNLLRTAQPIPVSDLPKSMRVMELKLTAGGISVGEVSHLKDLKYSAEYMLQEWLHKYGPAEADKRYQHLRVLVQEACNSSAVASRKSGTLYGEEMLADVRGQLRARTQQQAEHVLGLGPEQLLGVAGILTEDCRVWWSDEFPIGEGDNS